MTVVTMTVHVTALATAVTVATGFGNGVLADDDNVQLYLLSQMQLELLQGFGTCSHIKDTESACILT